MEKDKGMPVRMEDDSIAELDWLKLPWWKKVLVMLLPPFLIVGEAHPAEYVIPVRLFLFWCERCRRPAIDYEHGFSGKLYLDCSYCGHSRYLSEPSWYLSFFFDITRLAAKKIMRFFAAMRQRVKDDTTPRPPDKTGLW